MDKISQEIIKIVAQKFSPQEIYAEFDRRNAILKESKKIQQEIIELNAWVDENLANTDDEFEQRLKKFEEGLNG